MTTKSLGSETGSWESNELGERNIAVIFDPNLGVKTRSRLVCRPCDRTSGNLNKTSVREKFNGLSFYELFDDISLVLNVRRLCVAVDSLISAAKVCD